MNCLSEETALHLTGTATGAGLNSFLPWPLEVRNVTSKYSYNGELSSDTHTEKPQLPNERVLCPTISSLEPKTDGHPYNRELHGSPQLRLGVVGLQ